MWCLEVYLASFAADMSHHPFFISSLRDFQPENDEEAALLERLLHFLLRNREGALGTEVVEGIGHITAQAHIENPAGTKQLLVFSAKEGRWKLPGAHIEKEPLETAIKEATRALGRVAQPANNALYSIGERQIPEYWNTPEHTHFEITYRFVVDEVHDLPRGARWFLTEEAEEITRAKPAET
jgi:hypothetical protein